jgi:hypothetical protein
MASASRKTPGRFRSEAQEAEWWAKNQDYALKRFEDAKTAGTLGRGSVARLARQKVSAAGPSPTITIRIAETDLQRCGAGADLRGVPGSFLSPAVSAASYFPAYSRKAVA